MTEKEGIWREHAEVLPAGMSCDDLQGAVGIIEDWEMDPSDGASDVAIKLYLYYLRRGLLSEREISGDLSGDAVSEFAADPAPEDDDDQDEQEAIAGILAALRGDAGLAVLSAFHDGFRDHLAEENRQLMEVVDHLLKGGAREELIVGFVNMAKGSGELALAVKLLRGALDAVEPEGRA